MINLKTDKQFDTTIQLADNALLIHSPRLFIEWDFEKNDGLGLDIYRISKSYSKEVWWDCKVCKSNYSALISNRLKGNCPYCLGRRVNNTNSLASKNPELISEWHPILNGDLTPYEVTYGSGQKAWWKCKLEHEWDAVISYRSRGGGCPYCSNSRVLKGFNDINTTNIKLSSILLNYEDGYKYSKGSKVKLNWKCECGQTIKNKSPFIVDREGLCCPNCSDNCKSYPEKFIYHLLKQLNVDFKWEKTFKWSQRKRYDFYLPSYNMIIEVHGAQHYNGGFDGVGGRTLEEEQENDRLKEQLARENGIDNYIVIDARESELNWIKNSILNSTLSTHLNLENVNYENIELNARKRLITEIESLWNKNKSIKLIIETTGLDRYAVIRYLKTINTFNAKEDIDYIKKQVDNRRIIEYDCKNSMIKELEYSKYIYPISTISNLCNLNDKLYFKREYFLSNMNEIKNKIQKLSSEVICKRKIYQLDYNFELVKVWDDDYKQIAKYFNLNSTNLGAHLRGKQLSFADYLWSYEDELNTRFSFFKKSFNNANTYLIYQFDLDGNLINKWRNSSSTEYQNGVSINLNHIKKRVLDKNHYYKGFIFLKSYTYDSIKDRNSFFSELKNKYINYK